MSMLRTTTERSPWRGVSLESSVARYCRIEIVAVLVEQRLWIGSIKRGANAADQSALPVAPLELKPYPTKPIAVERKSVDDGNEDSWSSCEIDIGVEDRD